MIKARIPTILSLINRSIDELEEELSYLGRPVAIDASVMILIFSFPENMLLFDSISLIVLLKSTGAVVCHIRAVPCF